MNPIIIGIPINTKNMLDGIEMQIPAIAVPFGLSEKQPIADSKRAGSEVSPQVK